MSRINLGLKYKKNYATVEISAQALRLSFFEEGSIKSRKLSVRCKVNYSTTNELIKKIAIFKDYTKF